MTGAPHQRTTEVPQTQYVQKMPEQGRLHILMALNDQGLPNGKQPNSLKKSKDDLKRVGAGKGKPVLSESPHTKSRRWPNQPQT